MDGFYVGFVVIGVGPDLCQVIFVGDVEGERLHVAFVGRFCAAKTHEGELIFAGGGIERSGRVCRKAEDLSRGKRGGAAVETAMGDGD